MIRLKIKFRDDTKKEYICVEYPSVGESWVTIFLAEENNTKRVILRSETIETIEWYVEGSYPQNT